MPKKFHMAILPFTLVLLGAAPSGERNGPAPSVETHCFPDVKVPFGRNVDAHGFPVSVGSKDATKEFVENLLDPTEQMVLRTSGNLSHDLSEQPSSYLNLFAVGAEDYVALLRSPKASLSNFVEESYSVALARANPTPLASGGQRIIVLEEDAVGHHGGPPCKAGMARFRVRYETQVKLGSKAGLSTSRQVFLGALPSTNFSVGEFRVVDMDPEGVPEYGWRGVFVDRGPGPLGAPRQLIHLSSGKSKPRWKNTGLQTQDKEPLNIVVNDNFGYMPKGNRLDLNGNNYLHEGNASTETFSYQFILKGTVSQEHSNGYVWMPQELHLASVGLSNLKPKLELCLEEPDFFKTTTCKSFGILPTRGGSKLRDVDIRNMSAFASRRFFDRERFDRGVRVHVVIRVKDIRYSIAQFNEGTEEVFISTPPVGGLGVSFPEVPTWP